MSAAEPTASGAPEPDPSVEPRTGDPSFNPHARRCAATANRTGQQCGRVAVRGTTVCTTHGGSAPQVRAAAKRNVERARLEKLMMQGTLGQGAPAEGVDPLAAIMEEIGYAVQGVRWLRERVADLEPDAVVAGGRLHPAVELLRQWSAQLVATCRAAGSLGVDQSMIAGLERRELQAALVLERLLADASDVSPETRGRLMAELPEALRAGEGR